MKAQYSTQYTPEEYITEREWSSIPVLLVEGRDDRAFFQLMLDELRKCDTAFQSSVEVQIDTPELIKAPTDRPIGNREKVELVCNLAHELGSHAKLVGFVDREFRGFTLSPQIADELSGEFRHGRVLWTRGHSLENYLFEFDVLRAPFRNASVNASFDYQAALDLFEQNLSRILITSCSLSLAAHAIGLIEPIQNSLDARQITFSNDEITFDVDLWVTDLRKRQKLDQGRIDKAIEALGAWHEVVRTADSATIRWLCHGHIAHSFLWAAYAACAREIGHRSGIVSADTSVSQSLLRDRFIAATISWIGKYMDFRHGGSTPFECLRTLIAL